MSPVKIAICFMLLLFLTSCMPVNALSSTPSDIPALVAGEQLSDIATQTPQLQTIQPTATQTKAVVVPSETDANFSPSATPTLSPDAWKQMPVIPIISTRTKEIYQQGLLLGNDPQAFSKIGDGEISTLWFFTDFDLGLQFYDLGPYTDLQPLIEHFAGSFGWQSQAARRGFNTTKILDALEADPEHCNAGETPLECELRVHRPSIAIISLGTNQVFTPDIFEEELTTIIQFLIERGVVPVLATKADNLEGDFTINAIIARLAYQFEIPLWNFWLAVQPLPNGGLQADNEHLTYAENDFSNPETLKYAWPVRNLTALQVLQAVWESVR
jgi:hypothetical protein